MQPVRVGVSAGAVSVGPVTTLSTPELDACPAWVSEHLGDLSTLR